MKYILIKQQPELTISCHLIISHQAKHAFEQLREEIRNRNSEDINMLRISLDAQIEGKMCSRISICMLICLPFCLSVCLIVCLPFCSSVCLSVFLPHWSSVCLSVCLSISGLLTLIVILQENNENHGQASYVDLQMCNWMKSPLLLFHFFLCCCASPCSHLLTFLFILYRAGDFVRDGTLELSAADRPTHTWL